ncbi:hypothetical protein GA0070621_5296 [Micromonospora narathiwatensis]|uniref:Uncharacterized protein n=1 Tax=Micromonospora narathiwatensis TaxID=299146 RepID=A0A1A9ADQ7_9ACTN|nr:hypothetical protein GA0070621_5296 [Micromonospora narathiwatensis]
MSHVVSAVNPRRWGRRTSILLLAVAFTVVAGLLAGLAGISAAKSRSGLPTEVVRALDNLKRTGEISAKDRAVLLKHRSIAAQVIDPSKTRIVDESTGDAGAGLSPLAGGALTAGAAAAGKAGCHRADRYISYRTVLGSKAFDWHKVLHYCWSKTGKVTIKERRYYLKNNDGTNYDRGLISNTQTGKGTAHYASTMQGKVENCVLKYGCIMVKNPYIRIVVNGKKGLPYQIWMRK